MDLKLIALLLAVIGGSFAGQAGSKPSGNSKVQLSVDTINFAVYERSSSNPTTATIQANSKDSKASPVDKTKKLVAKFTVKDAAKKTPIVVQQAFVALIHQETGREVIFVAEPAADSKEYSVDIDFKAQESSFGGLNGKYLLHLYIGDAKAGNAINWHFADITATFNPVAHPPPKKSQIVNYDQLPEIEHKFREPEKRPPQVISDTFTLICLAPLLLLLILWLRVGINFGNIQISLWSLGFHAGLISIFCLYFTFWIRLNMFDTLKYLTFIGVPTFVCGNRLLRSLNYYRTQTKSE